MNTDDPARIDPEDLPSVGDDGVPMDGHSTLDELTLAIVATHLAGKPLKQPAFEGIAQMRDGQWIHVTYTANIEVSATPPEKILEHLRNQHHGGT